MDEQKKLSDDTIYEIPASNKKDAVVISKAVRQHFSKDETTPEDRKKQLLEQVKNGKKANTRKIAAKTAINIWDHADEILGMLERVMLLAVTELFRRGDWLAAITICGLAIIAWFIKIRKPEPGPVISFFRKDTKEMRASLAQLSKTEYWS